MSLPSRDAPAHARITENAFHVLGLLPDCARADVERAGRTLLDMLEVGLAEARTYTTPLGPRARTPELVRHAMAELRSPARRILHELWAGHPARPRGAPQRGATHPDDAAEPWPFGFHAHGWRRP
ncbi:MAG: hypothetical protein R3A51_09945 [Nannocystaceae bacterium]